MSPLEQALREAFTADVDDVGLTDLVADVRRGARRRRARRTVAATAGVAAAVALVIGIGGAVLLDDRDSPEPAPPPSPTVTLTDGAEVAPELPGRDAMAAESAGGVVWITVRQRDCRCAALWRHDGDGWRRVFDFPTEFVERLAFAPNGRDGLAANVDGGVWATHDGGRTWADAGLPDRPGGNGSFMVAADATRVWTAELGVAVWRAPVGTDAWQRVETPDVPQEVDLVDDALVVGIPREDEGNADAAPPVVTRDGGQSWVELPYPCANEHRLYATDGAGFSLCPEGRGAMIYRSLDAERWHELGRADRWPTYVVPLAADRVLLRILGPGRTDDVLLTEKEAVEIETGLGQDASTWDAATAEGTIYLATSEGVLVSSDRGLTWGPAE